MVYLLFLDDGHGADTPGKRTPYIESLGRQIHENEFNKPVVNFIEEFITPYGVHVFKVAPTDYDTSLQSRTDKANQIHREYEDRYGSGNVKTLYVSIHFNAMSYEFDYSSASGVSVHIYPGYRDTATGRAARLIGARLRQGTTQNYRGIKENNFHVLRETNFSAVLTENGFMDDRYEASLMLDEGFQREVAKEHTMGILDWYGISHGGVTEFSPHYLAAGMSGSLVKQLQENLLFLGYSLPEYGADGSFGPETENAVKEFQRDHGLTVDGSYGPKTQAKMELVVKATKLVNEELNNVANYGFTDVDENTPLNEEIKKASDLGLVNGYPDGSYKPQNNLTRAEYAAGQVQTYNAIIKAVADRIENG